MHVRTFPTWFAQDILRCGVQVMFATKLVWIIVLIWWLLFWGGCVCLDRK